MRYVMTVAGEPQRRCGVGDYARLLADAMPPGLAVLAHIPVPLSPVYRTHLFALMKVRHRVQHQTRALSLCTAGTMLPVASSGSVNEGAPPVFHTHYSDFSWNGVRAFEDCYELFTHQIERMKSPVPRLFVTLHEHPWFRNRHIWDTPGTLADRLFACLAGQYPIPPSFPLDLFRRHDGIHVHHEWHKSALVENGVPESVVRVIPHPVPECEAEPAAVVAFRQKYGLQGKRILAMTGFIFERKRYDRVIGILGSLPDDVALCALGGADGDVAQKYLKTLLKLAIEKAVVHRFVVTGYLSEEEMNAGLKAADVFVAPYGEVSSSGSVARCIAAGAPIVAGKCPTFDEMIKGGAGMVVVDPDNGVALTAAIMDVLNKKDLAISLQQQNTAYSKKWAFPAVAKMMQDWYQQ